MPLIRCPETPGQTTPTVGFDYPSPPPDLNDNFFATLPAAPNAPNFVTRINTEGTVAFGANFLLEIMLQTGPGPVYTDAVLLGRMSGTQPPGGSVTSSWPLSTVIATVNRPFDWLQDRFHITTRLGGTGSVPNGWAVFGRVCCETGTQDCCAELNAKLDLVISYVSAQLHNQP